MWGNCLLLKSQGITLPTTPLHEVSQPMMSQQNLIEFRQAVWAGLHVVAGFPNFLTERIYLRLKKCCHYSRNTSNEAVDGTEALCTTRAFCVAVKKQVTTPDRSPVYFGWSHDPSTCFSKHTHTA